MKPIRIVVAALCLAIVGGLSLELRRELRTFHAGEQARAPLVTVLTLGEKEAAANLFYSPNPNAMQVGAGVCINATVLDGGIECLYTLTVNSRGDLVVLCNAGAGATCAEDVTPLTVHGTQFPFRCDGGSCADLDAGSVIHY